MGALKSFGFAATATRKSTNTVVTVPLGTFFIEDAQRDSLAQMLAEGLQKEFEWGNWEIRIFSTDEKEYLRALEKMSI